MSMKLTPSSTARRRTAFATSRSAGGPQMPSPVIASRRSPAGGPRVAAQADGSGRGCICRLEATGCPVPARPAPSTAAGARSGPFHEYAALLSSAAWSPRPTLEKTEAGLVPGARDGSSSTRARRAGSTGRGAATACRSPAGRPMRPRRYFPQLGVSLVVLGPGEPIGMYHWEADQEDFLVLSGEALLIVEGQERPLRQWDFVHCPPETGHMIVGAGDGPCAVLAVGAREHIDETATAARTRWTRSPCATGRASKRRRATRGSRTPASGVASRRATATAGFRAAERSRRRALAVGVERKGELDVRTSDGDERAGLRRAPFRGASSALTSGMKSRSPPFRKSERRLR